MKDEANTPVDHYIACLDAADAAYKNAEYHVALIYLVAAEMLARHDGRETLAAAARRFQRIIAARATTPNKGGTHVGE